MPGVPGRVMGVSAEAGRSECADRGLCGVQGGEYDVDQMGAECSLIVEADLIRGAALAYRLSMKALPGNSDGSMR